MCRKRAKRAERAFSAFYDSFLLLLWLEVTRGGGFQRGFIGIARRICSSEGSEGFTRGAGTGRRAGGIPVEAQLLSSSVMMEYSWDCCCCCCLKEARQVCFLRKSKRATAAFSFPKSRGRLRCRVAFFLPSSSMREVIIGDLRLPMCQNGFLLSGFGNCAGGWDGTWVDAPRVEIRYHLFDGWSARRFVLFVWRLSAVKILQLHPEPTRDSNESLQHLQLATRTCRYHFHPELGDLFLLQATRRRSPSWWLILSLSLSFSILLVLGINFAWGKTRRWW